MKHELHGGSRTKLYSVWLSMKLRCNNPGATAYGWYGKRGIRVCKEWNSSFAAFRTWAYANGYKQGLEIDRIDNDSDYSPSNCRWVNRSQNMANTRSHRGATSKYKGVSWNSAKRKWVAHICKDYKRHYLGYQTTALAAALAYDDAAYKMQGEHSALNFPERKRKTAST